MCRVTVILILAMAFQALCQDCGEVGSIGDGNVVSYLSTYIVKLNT